MKANRSLIRLKAASGLWLMLVTLASVSSIQAAFYQPGQVVTNFTLYARPSWTNSAGFPDNAPMRLSDFAGKIIFAEFFDPTWSTCQFAVSMTLPGIRDWYNARKGTMHGIPLEHISANIIPYDFLQGQCDEFIGDRGITLAANDYNSDPELGPKQTNAVHDSFTTPLMKPLFVIINCVSNSPSHLQNVVLLNHSGAPGAGTQAEWNAAMTQWRALIDSVQAPPPALAGMTLTNGSVRFSFPGQRGRTNQVMVSSNLTHWTVLTNYSGTNALITFRDTNIQGNPGRFYRLRRL